MNVSDEDVAPSPTARDSEDAMAVRHCDCASRPRRSTRSSTPPTRRAASPRCSASWSSTTGSSSAKSAGRGSRRGVGVFGDVAGTRPGMTGEGGRERADPGGLGLQPGFFPPSSREEAVSFKVPPAMPCRASARFVRCRCTLGGGRAPTVSMYPSTEPSGLVRDGRSVRVLRIDRRTATTTTAAVAPESHHHHGRAEGAAHCTADAGYPRDICTPEIGEIHEHRR